MTETTERPKLDFEPETVENARSRYLEAVERTYTTEEMLAERPGRDRRHVFDFHDGLRLIITREAFNEGPLIHLSGSATEDSTALRNIKVHAREEWLYAYYTSLKARFREISLHYGPMRLVGISEEGIPHWVIEE